MLIEGGGRVIHRTSLFVNTTHTLKTLSLLLGPPLTQALQSGLGWGDDSLGKVLASMST